MALTLDIRNESSRKRLYRRAAMEELAGGICAGEGLSGPVEISVLFCDDPFMARLNRRFRNKRTATDVLSFEQAPGESAPILALGDVVISLETAERNCPGDRKSMRDEISLLFCHGLLHLLGYDHDAPKGRREMTAKQALYLGISTEDAWRFGPKKRKRATRQRPQAGG